MLKKEIIRENGEDLFRTFSDTDHRIRNKRTGEVYDDAIDASEAEEYEEVEDYIGIEGVSTYEEVLAINESLQTERMQVERKINRLALSDREALSVKDMFPRWEDKVDMTIELGFIVLYDGKLWRARQTHTALLSYPPSLDTASIYEMIVLSASGAEDDPIPYAPPMEIHEGKYYKQNEDVFLCIRSSGVALTHDLSTLVGIYVDKK